MKKLILSIPAIASLSLAGFAQGFITFDGSNNSNPSPIAAGSGLVSIDGGLDTATDPYAEPGSAAIQPIAAGATAYFQVEGWTGLYNTYAGGNGLAGQTGGFAEVLTSAIAQPQANSGYLPASNFIPTPIAPEPSTVALCALGSAVILVLRRRQKRF